MGNVDISQEPVASQRKPNGQPKLPTLPKMLALGQESFVVGMFQMDSFFMIFAAQ